MITIASPGVVSFFIKVRLAVVSVRKRESRSAIASLAKNYCAVIVLMHTNCFESVPFKDTK